MGNDRERSLESFSPSVVPRRYRDTRPHNGTNWVYTLGDAQYAWLQGTLKDSTANRSVVFTHNLVGGFPKTGEYNDQRGGARAATNFEWGGRSHDGEMEFDKYRAGWAAPIHDLLKAHGVDCVVHGHDHVTAVEFVDGVMYLELPWMKQGGASFEERVAYVGTKKAFYDEERPAYARFSAAGGGLALEVRDIYSDAVVYGYDFANIDSDAFDDLAEDKVINVTHGYAAWTSFDIVREFLGEHMKEDYGLDWYIPEATSVFVDRAEARGNISDPGVVGGHVAFCTYNPN